jgi:RimJ/RimL family protein N-acetyltransferase
VKTDNFRQVPDRKDSIMQWVLETERLQLRRFTEADAEALLHLESDPEVLRHVGRGPLADVEAYRQHIQSRLLPYYDRPEGFGGWAIIEKASGEFLGGCSLKPALDSRNAVEMGYGKDEVELGYGLRQLSWGRGYATELARALVRKAFTELGAVCLVASVMIANQGSIRVLEKAGLRPVGAPVYLPGEDEPSVKYALTREQFDQDRFA